MPHMKEIHSGRFLQLALPDQQFFLDSVYATVVSLFYCPYYYYYYITISISLLRSLAPFIHSLGFASGNLHLTFSLEC